MKYLIANLVVEMNPIYDNLKNLAAPFVYNGNQHPLFSLSYTEEQIKDVSKKYVDGSTLEEIENSRYSSAFNRAIIKYNAILIHSSVIVYNGGGYMFSADSGVGKSTHTRLWLSAFGNKVHILNDDKPVVRIENGHATIYGTPFDGGSGIALNESVPLKAIVFIERGDENSVRIPSTVEILQKLYFQTVNKLSEKNASLMLETFSQLISLTKFYILTCNMDISAAYTAFDAIAEKD